MERVAIGFLCGLGILGAIAFLVILKLRDSGDRIFKTFLAVFGFLASVATIVGIAIQIWDWNGPPSQTVVPVVTVVGMRAPSDALTVPLATAVPATTTAAPNVAPPTAAPPPLLPETLAELHYYSDLKNPDSDPSWPTMGEGGGRADYDEYGYTIHSEESRIGWLVGRDMALYGDFALQIDVTPLTSGEATAYSIGFDWTSDNSGYYLLVEGYGRCSLVVTVRGETRVVERNNECPRLSRDVLNKLLLVVEGQKFLAAMDDNVVLRAEMNERYAGPRVILNVFSRKESEAAEVRFNNLSIWQR